MRLEFCLSDGIDSHKDQVEAETIDAGRSKIFEKWSDMLYVAWVRVLDGTLQPTRVDTQCITDEQHTQQHLLYYGYLAIEGKFFPVTGVSFIDGFVHSFTTRVGRFKARKFGVVYANCSPQFSA